MVNHFLYSANHISLMRTCMCGQNIAYTNKQPRSEKHMQFSSFSGITNRYPIQCVQKVHILYDAIADIINEYKNS